ncbi:hypothetical protein Poli38472_004949 [Pythium oligandrum]|uniref:Uncharacterized protein n=1 Tax=Pythium oligandrum TaxID=41045 RepID=A0A8K1FDX1_PYTOL|nr:hypothetical protein Poli38472_004949 [Pythium oligandrum]|eukprot:TMW59880.1 hypothetical protein Poli38472_004949 [Pythium oligandrum]
MASKETKRAPLKNVSRERMKIEFRYLRELLVQLERERFDLFRASRVRRAVSQRAIAEEEYEKRKQAERLNAQLRDKLNEQTAVVEYLKELINRLSDQVDDVYGCCHSHFDRELFSRFNNDILEGYRMTDSIVDTADWRDEATHGLWQVATRVGRHNGRSHTVLEVQKRFWTPSFPFVQGEGELKSWKYAPQFYSSSPLSIDEIVVQETALMVRCHHPYLYRGKDVNIAIDSLMKRFVERSREVRVWRSKIAGESTDQEQVMLVEVVGWSVIQPFADGVVTHVCAHIVPKVLETNCTGLTPQENDERTREFAEYATKMLQTDASQVIKDLNSVEYDPQVGR